MNIIDTIAHAIKRNSATILTVISAVGVGATAVLAVRSTFTATKRIEKAEKELGGELELQDKVKMVAKDYIPPALCGAATIACIIGASIINKKTQASLVSAYGFAINHLNSYRNSVAEVYGDDADKKVKKEMVRNSYGYHIWNVDTPDRLVVFYDEESGERMVKYEREIMDAEYHFNRNFTRRGYAYLNEWYYFLGLPKTDYGDLVGWDMADGYSWVDFKHVDVSGTNDVYVITPDFAPDVLDDSV